MRRLVVSAAVVGVAGSIATPIAGAAPATTPGANGVVAFVRGAGTCQDIETVRPSDRGVTKLTNCPQFVGSPAWSPDGTRLAVSYVHDTGNARLALLKATGGTPQVLTTGVTPANSPVFSRSGSTLAFAGGDAGGDDNSAIYTVPVGGGAATKLVGGAQGEVNDEPDWSPTADTITWARRTGPMYDVWTMTVDGTGHSPTALTDLTNATGNSRWPSWSPDGTKIAFASDRSGTWQIYVMAADGTNVIPITTSGQHIEPAWSPDGTKLAFVTGCTTAGCATSGPNDHRVNGDIQVVDVTDLAHPGAPQTLVATTASEFDPQWAVACTGQSCPPASVLGRTVILKPIHHLVATGRVVATKAPVACTARVPLVLQYENAIYRGDQWHHNGHWVTEGKGRTTSTGRFRLHLPPRLTGWYRVAVGLTRVGSQACAAAASPLRVNNFIRDPKGDSRGPVDIAWGDASIQNHVVTFTLHTYSPFSSSQRGVPCVLFMKHIANSRYGGAVGCFGGLLLNDQHKPLTIRRPDSRTIIYSFKESELDPGFTNFEWVPWSRGISDEDLYDVAPNDSELGNGAGQRPYPPDMPILFKYKPTYHH